MTEPFTSALVAQGQAGACVQVAMATTFRLLTNATTESEKLAHVQLLHAFIVSQGWDMDVHRGCVLAFARQHGDVPPRDVLLALRDALGGACTGATLQTGPQQLLEWVLGECCARGRHVSQHLLCPLVIEPQAPIFLSTV